MPSTIEQTLFTLLNRHFGSEDILRGERIQSLWSGYGEIVRYRINSVPVVVKVVNPSGQGSHPRGWNTSLSHQRKLDSYQNEQAFYALYSQQTDALCKLPNCIASGETDGIYWLVMDDLDAQGFTYRCDQAPLDLVHQGIRWLAYFHARFLGQSLPELWRVGTYWHLTTRPDEWQKMADGALKQRATVIDDKLNQARYQTLVHGDAKLANFCFQQDHQDLAAVDFQYVGRGVGIKDVVYFLGGCFDDNGLYEHADKCLDLYFNHLNRALEYYNIDCDLVALENEWRALYPFAWADFQRFLKGWATEHYKLGDYSQQQTRIVLSQLD